MEQAAWIASPLARNEDEKRSFRPQIKQGYATGRIRKRTDFVPPSIVAWPTSLKPSLA